MKTKPVHNVRCSEVAKYICENLDEQMDSRKCRSIKKHLQACPKCAAQLNVLKKTVFLYRNCTTPTLSEQSHKRIIDRLSFMFKNK